MPGDAAGAGSLEPRRVTVEAGHALAESGQAVLVDVRDPHLFDNAHIRGAWSLPHGVIDAEPGRLPAGLPPGPGLILLYCA